MENKRTPESITNTMKNLAFCYRALKKPEKALQLDRELQKAYVETYGEDHILSLSAEGDIASDLLALGRQDEAETLLRQSLQTYQNKHGESHTYTLAAMSKLARVLTFGKKYEEALELYRREYELWKAKSGDAHPETCLALHNLADAYWRMGDRPRAYALNEEALKHMHDGCGINDPRSRPILYSLRGAYNAPGEYEKGEAVCREGLEILKKNPHLEKQNPDNRQLFLEWLCFYLSKQGRLKEAEETAIALGTNNE